MWIRTWMPAAALGLGLVACGGPTETINLGKHGHIRFDSAEVTIARSTGPDAHLGSGGTFRIGGEQVVLSPEQRVQVASYYGAARAMRAHTIETGKAGAEVGLTAAKEVVSGLAHGDTSQVGTKVEAQAQELKRTAQGICTDLASMRTAQQALVTSLESFRPYAVIEESDVADCDKDFRSGKPAG